MTKFEKIAKKTAMIAKLQAEVLELQSQADNEVDPSTVVVGAAVEFIYGRAENKKSLAGVVTGVKSQEKGGALVRIRVGEGFDEQTYTVFVNAVTKVVGDEPAAE